MGVICDGLWREYTSLLVRRALPFRRGLNRARFRLWMQLTEPTTLILGERIRHIVSTGMVHAGQSFQSDYASDPFRRQGGNLAGDLRSGVLSRQNKPIMSHGGRQREKVLGLPLRWEFRMEIRTDNGVSIRKCGRDRVPGDMRFRTTMKQHERGSCAAGA